MLDRAAFQAILFLLLPAVVPGDPVSGFVEVPGGKLWYEARGQGTPMVLIHDGLLPSETWDEQAPAFARNFRVIRYDRRGYGRSEPAKAPFSDIQDLHALFESLKLDRAVLVACSYGGSLAVDFALAHPDRVKSLVLVGPVLSGFPYSTHFTRRNLRNIAPRFQGDLQKTVEAWASDRYITDASNAAARERVRELLTKDPASLKAGRINPTPPERPATGRLSEIRKPTLIVLGASDIPDVHAHAGAIEAGIAGARRVVIAKAGHLAHMEKPEEFNETVLTFLQPAAAAQEYLRTLTPQPAPRLFDYDSSAPLDIKEAGVEKRGDVRVVDLTYESPMGGRVPAYLMLPSGEGKHAAVLFLHPGQGNRSTFVDEAVELARDHGIVSLTIDAPFLRPELQARRTQEGPLNPARDRREALQAIVDLRRGFDLLASRPEVDPKRMAYVGHSLGATLGGTLAGIEKRPVAFVLMAGFPSLTRSYTNGENQIAYAFQELLPRERQEAYVKAMAPLDAVHYVGQAAPAKILFQFAKRDEFITSWDAEVYTQAASGPKEVRWYDTGHLFNEEARRE
ncbi:MAG TPA: alpha/beta fold hydrolase, partial [Thermoanaerobaculia bacterium]